MAIQHDALLRAAEELKQALDDNATGRSAGALVHHALSEVERALGESISNLPDADEFQPPDDRALLPSPGLERKAKGLRKDLRVLMQEVRTLRAEAGAPRQQSFDPGHGDLLNRLRDLASRLQRHEHGEIELVQQGIVQDIGAGD